MEWQQKNPDMKIRVGDFCKMAFVDGETTEHMWVLVTDTLANHIFKGNLNSTPQIIRNVQPLQEIFFEYDKIEDHVPKPAFL